MGSNLHNPLDSLILVITGLVQRGVAIVPHTKETLARVVDADKLSSDLLIVRVVHHETRVASLVFLVNIVEDKFLFNNLI